MKRSPKKRLKTPPQFATPILHSSPQGKASIGSGQWREPRSRLVHWRRPGTTFLRHSACRHRNPRTSIFRVLRSIINRARSPQRMKTIPSVNGNQGEFSQVQNKKQKQPMEELIRGACRSSNFTVTLRITGATRVPCEVRKQAIKGIPVAMTLME